MRYLLALMLVGLTAPALAQERDAASDAQESARIEAGRLLEEAQAHDDANRPALAAQSYLAMYEVMRRAGLPRAPIALYSAGRALARLPGREQEARETLQRFLTESTPLTDDADVRDWRSNALEQIAELEARAGANDSATEANEPEAQAQPVGPAAPAATTVSPVGVVVLVAGLASLAVGGVFGTLALTRESDLANRCGGLTCLDTPEHRGVYDEMRTFGTVTDVLLVVGGLAAVAGTVLAFTLTEGRTISATARVRLDGAELVVGGSF